MGQIGRRKPKARPRDEYGRAPEQRTTAAGKAMVTGAMVVDLGRDAQMPEWTSLVAFGSISEVRVRHAKGDMVAVGGRKLSKSAWKAQDGTAHTGFSVLVDSIASARTVRPGKAPKARREDAVPLDVPLCTASTCEADVAGLQHPRPPGAAVPTRL